ncbi:MAG: phage tail protein, partial [Desulfobulbus sp.]|nr:phage tail protein [Desulfobulbus sp.]
MVMPHELLPPNRTPLETAIADTAPRLILDDLADTHRLLKFYPPDSILPWLASEWFLSGFVKYFPDLRDLIDAGLPWLLERGTAASVKRALSWIGLDVTLEEDGPRLQMDTGRALTPDKLADLVYLVLASIPAHVDLYRLYHDYDLRPIGLSMLAALDDGLLSDDSGIWLDVD